MTPIEELLREALASTPEPPVVTDPLGALDRRVRRARRWLAAGGVTVTVAVVAAVVVPTTVLDSGGSPTSVGVATTPTPSPLPPLTGTTALWTHGAIWASTSRAGQRWMLYDDQGQSYVTEVSGGQDVATAVQSPADYVAAGDHVVWVIGGGDGGTHLSRLSVIQPGVASVPTLTFDNAVLSYAAVVGDSLYVTAHGTSGESVDRVDLVDGTITVTASTSIPGAAEIVAARDGHLWVHASNDLVEIVPTPSGFRAGPDGGADVRWGSGQIFAPVRGQGGGIWAYDGDRLIGLMPSALAGCVSCAEGDRVTVQGRPTEVVQDPGGGLFVAVAARAEIDYYSPSDLGAGDGRHSASLNAVEATTMTADPTGGVDYVDDRGQLVRWAPAAA